MTFEPGSHFLYNTGRHLYVGSDCLQSNGDLLRITQPFVQTLGISGYDWETVSPMASTRLAMGSG